MAHTKPDTRSVADCSLSKLGHSQIRLRTLRTDSTLPRIGTDQETRNFPRTRPRAVTGCEATAPIGALMGFGLDRAGVARFSDSDQIPKLMISTACCRLDCAKHSTGTTLLAVRV